MFSRFVAFRPSDFFLVLFVLAIALMLFIPLPTITLDFLLTANMAFAFLLLLVGLYMPNSLALLAFPSLLLLTTLFRLALNVASTRLILSQGEAGQVIEAFGTFLISDQILVGIVIFIIITIVNLLVIAKGAGRVSEVAARFALDALPGKQIAIDADLRAGLIDANQAQEKRDNLRKESQLYGAMDGSMKFVQNDAIAGILIIFTNIIGGMYQGVASGLSFSEASQVYTTLTVGDGLVTQIPALLISICAGIVVTRVSADERSTLGVDVSKQVFQNPYLLTASAVLLAALGLISNLPILPFTVICSAMIICSVFIFRKNRENALNPEKLSNKILDSSSASKSLLLESGENRLICYLADDLYSYYKKNVHSIHESWLIHSNNFLDSGGLDLPDISVVCATNLNTGSVKVVFERQTIVSLNIIKELHYTYLQNWQLHLIGIQSQFTFDCPLSGKVISAFNKNKDSNEIIDELNIKVYDFFDFISLHIRSYFFKFPEDYFTASYINERVSELDSSLKTTLLRPEFITQVQLSELICGLIKSKLPIRNFKYFLESIASYCDSKIDLEQVDFEDLLYHLRAKFLKKTIGDILMEEKMLINLLSSKTEKLLRETNINSSEQFIAPPELINELDAKFEKVVKTDKSKQLSPLVFLCRLKLKDKLVAYLKLKEVKLFNVLTFEDLPNNSKLLCIGEY